MHLSLELDTRGDGDFLDVTAGGAEKVKGGGVASGVVVVLVLGSTAGIILNENEPGLLEDLRALGNRLVPPLADYRHNQAWQEKEATSPPRARPLRLPPSPPLPGGPAHTWPLAADNPSGV